MSNNQITLLGPKTGAVTLSPFPSNQYKVIVVSADALAGGETVNILMVSGSTNLQVLMPDNTTPAKLTATLSELPLLGGPSYIFDKSATASACGVYVDCQQR